MFSQRDVCTRHQQSHIEGEPLSIGNSNEFGSVVEAPVEIVDSQGDEQLQQSKPDVEFFDCKVGLAMTALFDDFSDARAFKTAEGV